MSVSVRRTWHTTSKRYILKVRMIYLIWPIHLKVQFTVLTFWEANTDTGASKFYDSTTPNISAPNRHWCVRLTVAWYLVRWREQQSCQLVITSDNISIECALVLFSLDIHFHYCSCTSDGGKGRAVALQPVLNDATAAIRPKTPTQA